MKTCDQQTHYFTDQRTNRPTEISHYRVASPLPKRTKSWGGERWKREETKRSRLGEPLNRYDGGIERLLTPASRLRPGRDGRISSANLASILSQNKDGQITQTGEINIEIHICSNGYGLNIKPFSDFNILL